MDIFRATFTRAAEYLPYLIGALVVLVIGWLVAWLIGGLVRRGLERTGAGRRLTDLVRSDRHYPVEHWIGRGVFWVLMLFVLVGALSILQPVGLSQSVRNVVDPIVGYLPRLVGATLLLIGVWVLASVLRIVTTRALAGVDRRLAARGLGGTTTTDPAHTGRPLSRSLGQAVFWLTFLLFLPAMLDVLAMEGVVAPVRGMLAKILDFLPNVVIAGLILAVGWFLAGLLRQIVVNVLAAIGTDSFAQRAGLDRALGQQSLARLTGMVVYVLVLIPVVIASLGALQLQAITGPAQTMLTGLLAAVPALFAAALLLALAGVVGRLLGRLTSRVLTAANADRLAERVGWERTTFRQTPSQVAGVLVFAAVMLVAVVAAFRLLGLSELAALTTSLVYLLGRIVLGLALFALGVALANVVGRVIESRTTTNQRRWSLLGRSAVLVLAGAIALQTMGLANAIVALAFGLSFGAVAVAAAIAFGLGGRDLAHRKLEEWDERWREPASSTRQREREEIKR